MINKRIKRIEKICTNYWQIENYQKAIADKTQTWHCHHRKETDEGISGPELIKLGLYYDRPPEELIFLTKSEHAKLHGHLHKQKEETKEKLRQANLGKKPSNETIDKLRQTHSGENNGFYGKHHNTEFKKEHSKRMKDYYNNEVNRKKHSESLKEWWRKRK